MMLPKERVIATLEHRPVDRAPVGEIDVGYTITDRALGYKTLYQARWREYQPPWQGRRNEIVESYKQDIVTLASKFEWGVVPSPRHSSYEPPEFLDEFRWITVDGSEWVYSPLGEGHTIRVKFPEMTTENIAQPQPVDESELEVAEHIVKELDGTHFIIRRPAVDGTFPYDESVGLQELLIGMISEPDFVSQAISAYTDRTI